jgi:hypothetical protein
MNSVQKCTGFFVVEIHELFCLDTCQCGVFEHFKEYKQPGIPVLRMLVTVLPVLSVQYIL